MISSRRRIAAVGVLFIAAMLGAPPICAQAGAAYPARTVRLVVAYAAGGSNDIVARALAQRLTEAWGQTVIIDNKPGGNTVIGSDFVAKAAPDGYTLLGVAVPFALLGSLSPQAKIDPLRDFTPVAYAGFTPNILVVNTATPYKTVKDLIEAARAKPGSIAYASTGNGTSNHLSMELFKAMAGVDLTHIPYKGSAPAVTDLIGGQVQALFDNTPNVLPQIKAGKLRALAVTSAKRFALVPDLPTMAEAGVPGYEVSVWFGTVAPAGTPREVVQKINTEINRILALPEVKERFSGAGIEIVGGSPETFGALLRKDVAMWAKVVKDANIKAD